MAGVVKKETKKSQAPFSANDPQTSRPFLSITREKIKINTADTLFRFFFHRNRLYIGWHNWQDKSAICLPPQIKHNQVIFYNRWRPGSAHSACLHLKIGAEKKNS